MKTKFKLIQFVTFFSIISLINCKGNNKKEEVLFQEPEVNYSQQEFYAYNMNSISMWKEIVNNLEKEYLNSPGDTIGLFKLIRAQYGLLTVCIGNHDKETFDANVKSFDNNIGQLLKLIPQWSAVYAIQAGVYGLKMGFDPAKGMSLGPKSGKVIEKAIKYNENEPTAWQQKAGSKLNTPKQFGGSIPEAIECYKKAIELFELNDSLLIYNWQYLSSLTWLGIAYEKNGQYQYAINTYEKALKFAPDYGWIKYVLYPEAKSKLEDINTQ